MEAGTVMGREWKAGEYFLYLDIDNSEDCGTLFQIKEIHKKETNGGLSILSIVDLMYVQDGKMTSWLMASIYHPYVKFLTAEEAFAFTISS